MKKSNKNKNGLTKIEEVQQDHSQGLAKKCYIIGKIGKQDQDKLKKKDMRSSIKIKQMS